MVPIPLARPLHMRIRTYLMLLVLGSAMPFVVLSGILVTEAASTQVEGFGRDVISVARALSSAVDGRIAPLQSALEALSRSRALADGDLVAFRAEIGDAAALLGGTVVLTDADGRFALDTRIPPGGTPSGGRTEPGYVASVIAGGRTRVSGVQRGPVSGLLLAMVDVPVRFAGPDGAVIDGVLSSTIDFAAINDLVTRQMLPRAWLGGIIDREGLFIQRTVDNARWQGTMASTAWVEAARRAPTGWIRSEPFKGHLGYTGFVTSAVTGWTVGIAVPYPVVWASLQRLLLLLLGFGTMLGALGLTLAMLLARRIVRPIGDLARLAVNPDSAMPARRSGIYEVEKVASALRRSIAARITAEAALRDSEAELRAATELSLQGRWTAGPDGGMLSASPQLTAATGMMAGRRLGRSWMEFIHSEDRRGMQAAWTRSVATTEPFDHEFRMRLVGGSWRWFRARAMPRRDAAGTVIRWYGTSEDVHARKAAVIALQRMTEELEARVEHEVAAREAAQARLNQAQRLQALGQLAGGIAHDFNNVLQVVGGALALISQHPDNLVRVARLAKMAEDATARGAVITGRLLSLTRQGTLRSGPVDAAPLLSDMAVLLTHTLGATIAIRVEAAADLQPMLADRGQLETVLINLATNARDAMPDGGSLTLSAVAELDPGSTRAGAASGGYIRIEIRDTGSGMDAATLARASEPFFTTKAVGRGTGLGLAMALGFVEQSGGELRIESAPGQGTTVRLWLPCTEPAAMPQPVAPPVSRRRGRVLLVDDDPLVRSTLAEQLQELGFNVLTAGDGAAGLAALAGDAEVALLVSDLTMPGMDGVSLIRAAQQARPGLPAILVTGYAGGAAFGAARALDGPFTLLHKPVSAGQLAARIATLVERRADR